MEFNLGDKDEVQPFKIKIGLQAEFVYQDETSKPHIHCESFRMIFPYLRMIITNLTTMCGMPGLFIPYIEIKEDSVRDIASYCFAQGRYPCFVRYQALRRGIQHYLYYRQQHKNRTQRGAVRY